MLELGNRIRNIRRENKMTLIKLSEKTGLDMAYISKIENNIINKPSNTALIKIANGLGVKIGDLLDVSEKDMLYKRYSLLDETSKGIVIKIITALTETKE